MSTITQRRMFSMKIIDTDLFLDMPASTQMLYFHLCMRADDDGFISNPKRVQRMIGASDDDIKLLVAKQFIIPFESGVCVIKHWRIHNYIQKDRYTATFQKFEKEMLNIDESGAYELDTECIQDVSKMLPQVRLGKDKLELGKDSNSIEQKKDKPDKKQELINTYTENEILKETILEFMKMRKAIKKPLTDRALKLILGRLNELTKDENIKIAILNQSIMNSWQGIFELKEGGTNGKYTGNNQSNKQSEEGTGGMSEESKRLLELARQRGHLDNLKDDLDIDF